MRLTTPPSPDTAAAPIHLQGGAVAISGRPILRGIDFSVSSGEFVALLGANGSGKSTLIRALTGLRPLTRGHLDLFGTPIDRFKAWHRVGFVPQRATAASGVPASVGEVVASGRLTRRRALYPASRADRRAITDALELVGLADRRHDNVAHLSGGQQQRVLIARALAGEPELLFLDEPTAGVDALNQQALADALSALADNGATVVLVTHELGPLRALVDRSVIMRDGRIWYDGAPLNDDGLAGGWLLGPHDHHHTDHAHQQRHTPVVSAPWEAPSEGAHP